MHLSSLLFPLDPPTQNATNDRYNIEQNTLNDEENKKKQQQIDKIQCIHNIAHFTVRSTTTYHFEFCYYLFYVFDIRYKFVVNHAIS